MKLKLSNGSLYLDGMFICFAETEDLLHGTYSVEARYSHAHGEEMVHVDTVGWVGATRGCDVVVGRVKSSDGLIPCQLTAERLLQNIANALDVNGERVRLEVV